MVLYLFLEIIFCFYLKEIFCLEISFESKVIILVLMPNFHCFYVFYLFLLCISGDLSLLICLSSFEVSFLTSSFNVCSSVLGVIGSFSSLRVFVVVTGSGLDLRGFSVVFLAKISVKSGIFE